jgi:hypothetical protein
MPDFVADKTVDLAKSKLINSRDYSGLDCNQAIEKISFDLKAQGLGSPKIMYKMRVRLVLSSPNN